MRMKALIAAVGCLTVISQTAQSQDIAAGEKLFAKCKVCHVVDSDKHKVGPSLQGIFGRTAGTVAGFKFSAAMIDAGNAGKVWDETTLPDYLRDPKGAIKGTKMAFAGIKKEDELSNLIAYMKSVSP